MAKTILAADLFCGAGGASSALLRAARARGLRVKLLAVNHWPTAIQTHSLNHPDVRHLCEAIERVDPRKEVPGGRLHVLLAGPECTHHARARGGKPMNDQSRSTAWSILKWAQELYIDNILIENVEEFMEWGPLGADGRPLKSRKGETYRAFIAALESLGYRVEFRVLNAADYGDPTTRRRLFILAKRGRRPMAWPMPTHSRTGQSDLFGPTKKWRAAREVLDFSIPGRSIFKRKKPLAPKTLARIMAGLERFGGKDLEPFLVILRNNADAQSLDRPVPTIAAQGQHLALCEPFVLQQQSGGVARPVTQPLPTIATDGAQMLIEPFLIPHYGERPTQAPRTHSVDEPIPSIPATGSGKFELVEPFLASYYGTQNISPVSAPVPTITTKDRFALVMPVVNGQALDIRLRMLTPRELGRAMSFEEDYVFTGNKGDQVKQIGNAWPGSLGEALNGAILDSYVETKRDRKAA